MASVGWGMDRFPEPRRSRLAAVLAAAGLVLAAGCGDDAGPSPAPAAPTDPEPAGGEAVAPPEPAPVAAEERPRAGFVPLPEGVAGAVPGSSGATVGSFEIPREVEDPEAAWRAVFREDGIRVLEERRPTDRQWMASICRERTCDRQRALVALYRTDEAVRATIHALPPVAEEAVEVEGECVEIPEVAYRATFIHHMPPDATSPVWHLRTRWIGDLDADGRMDFAVPRPGPSTCPGGAVTALYLARDDCGIEIAVLPGEPEGQVVPAERFPELDVRRTNGTGSAFTTWKHRFDGQRYVEVPDSRYDRRTHPVQYQGRTVMPRATCETREIDE